MSFRVTAAIKGLAPPATAIVWPVTQEASGEARNSATLATSSGRPMRPNGIEFRTAL